MSNQKSLKKTIAKNKAKKDIERIDTVRAFFVFAKEQSLRKRIRFAMKIIFKRFDDGGALF